MDNNYNQQPQYQQPQYQQPQYQPPVSAAPVPARPQGAGIAGLVDFLVKLAPVVILIFLCLGGVGFLYYFIGGIVDALPRSYEYVSKGFSAGIFFGGIAGGLSTAAKYCFYSVVVAFAAKLLKK